MAHLLGAGGVLEDSIGGASCVEVGPIISGEWSLGDIVGHIFTGLVRMGLGNHLVNLDHFLLFLLQHRGTQRSQLASGLSILRSLQFFLRMALGTQ
jgi:hypothetical protein